MELFGKKLREVREEKKYTVDQVARDTRISKRYIIALENEDFSIFPGETYLIGFLRSYAEYLELNPDHYVNLYKNLKIQEQPIPFDELLDKKRKMSPVAILLLSLVGVGIICSVFLLIYFNVFNKPVVQNIASKEEEIPVASDDIYIFNQEVMTRWFKQGDIVKIPIGENEYELDIVKAEENLSLRIGDKESQLTLGHQESFDLNADNKVDLTLVFNDFKETDSGKQVNLGFYKITVSKPIYTGDENDEDSKTEDAKVVKIEEDSNSTSEDNPTAENTENTNETIRIIEDTRTLVLEADEKEPFTVNIIFKGYCLIRYFVDNNILDQRFFRKDEILNLDVNNNVKLWVSNASSVKVKISGKELILGRAGQIVTKLIHWIKDEVSGKYQLEIFSVY